MTSRWSSVVAGAALLLAGVVAMTGDARAGDSTQKIRELQQLLANLENATDPGDRKKLIAQLAAIDLVRAAERLRRIARTDPDPSVRVEAITALGRSPVAEALDFLLELVVEGGPREIRQAHGRAVARRNGRDALLARLDKTDDPLGRGLIVAALAEDPSFDAACALEKLARNLDAHLRVEAIRALARHAKGRQFVPDVLREVLRKHHDLDTVLAALDVAESLADADFQGLADLLSSFLEPEVQSAVDAVRRRLDYLAKLEAARRARLARKDSEYDTDPLTEPLPEPPTPRPRVDIVYMFDASGSVAGYLDVIHERIRREAATLGRVGTDFRIGVVAYRDVSIRRDTWNIRVLPLTYDIARAETFIDAVSNKGCGSGAAIVDALEASMDRMGWRWGALRQVGLISDSKTGDVERSREIVKLHYQADRLRLHVWYLYRTRPQVPPDVEELASVGGGIVESLE